MDNWGAVTISAPLTVVVISNASVVSSRPSILNNKADIHPALSLKLAPNPVKNSLNIYTSGFQNKTTTLSVISASGITIKTIRLAGFAQNLSLNVASLLSGVYTIKLVNDKKAVYRKFVKL